MTDDKPSSKKVESLVPKPWRDRAQELGISIAEDATVTKSQLARIEGVSAPAVTKWIATEKLSGSALVGEGRKARVYLPDAFEQLREGLNINQTTTQRSTAEGRDIAFTDCDTPGGELALKETASAPAKSNSAETGTSSEAEDEDKSLASARRLRLSDAKIAKAEADAMLARRRAEQEAGNWISRADHEAAVSRIMGMCIELMEGWNMTGAEHVAGLVEGLLPNEIQVVLSEATRKDRERFAARCRNLAVQDTGE